MKKPAKRPVKALFKPVTQPVSISIKGLPKGYERTVGDYIPFRFPNRAKLMVLHRVVDHDDTGDAS